jgi:hypothetical protein
LYSFSNYSKFGNDVPAHIYFFLSIIYFLDSKDYNKENFNKICILSSYAFLNKVFLGVSLLLPLIVLIEYKKINYLKCIKIYFSFIFIIFWLIKNILTSGCLIYPIKELCYSKIFWLNEKEVVQENISGEAWAKGWIDQKNNIIDMRSYNNNFLWVKTWKEFHLKIILKKILPFIFIIFVMALLRIVVNKKYDDNIQNPTNNNKKKIFIVFFISLLGLIIFFLKFPLYRYGLSYISIFIITVSIYIFNILKRNNLFFFNKNFYKKLIVLCFAFFLLVNLKRIILNYDKQYYDYPWPKIYSFTDKNFQIKSEGVVINNEIIFFKSKEMCMYSNSPCTNYYDINPNFKKKLGYKIFYN